MRTVKHVVTGGPCTGKTTTVEALRKRGFRVIEEASRILIEEQNRKGGDIVPWKRLYDFNVAVTRLQQKLESKAREGVWFADRGVIDNLAYCEWGNIDPPPELTEAVKRAKYGNIFLLLPLGKFESDSVRKDTKEDAIKLTALIKKHYQKVGYGVVDIPPVSVDKRVEIILQKL